MKFVITEKGLIPEKHKDTFDPFWGKSLFHDYFEHFFEGLYPFQNELYEDLIGELASMGSSYYSHQRKIAFYNFNKQHSMIFSLCEEIYLLSTSEYVLKTYSKNFKELEKVNMNYEIDDKDRRHFKTISKIVWDKIKKYKPDFVKMLCNNYDEIIYKALTLGYSICKNKFDKILFKNLYNFNRSLERLKNKDCKWFYDNFKSAEIITNKKKKIKLKFYK